MRARRSSRSRSSPSPGRRRARRSGAIAAAALLAAAAIDAAIGAFPAPPTAPIRKRSDPVPVVVPASPLPAAGSFAVLVFAGRDPDGQSALPAPLLRASAARFDCDPPIEVVETVAGEPLGEAAALEAALERYRPGLVLVLAANAVLDEVIAELPAVDFPAPEATSPRGSPLGSAIERAIADFQRERRWRRALGAEIALDPRTSRVVARYRELVLAARRAGADVMLAIPPLAADDRIRAAERDAPHARAWLLASRAHARSVLALAGSYGIPAIDARSTLEGDGSEAFAELGWLDAPGRERLAEVVADAIRERVVRTAPGCRARGPS
jgi:hypothetical protein